MATQINVNGKIIKRPGVYASIKSGIKNNPANLSFGNIVIIDDGIGAGYGGGSGVSGALASGEAAAYTFETIQDFQNFVKGGELWAVADDLFRPKQGVNGVSKVILVQARTTTQATLALTFTNGTLTLKTKDEGLNANGTLVGGNLTKGHAITFIESPNTAGKYILQFWHGAYKGIDALNNTPYDGLTEANAKPILLLQSPEVSTPSELYNWLISDDTFNSGYVATTFTSTGNFVAGDITSLAGYQLFAGATEAYNATDVDAAITAIKNLDFTFFLCTKYGVDATSLNNTKIFDFLINDSKFERFMYVGGSYDKANFSSQSIGAATFYDSDKVVVVHGGYKKTKKGSKGFNVYSSFRKAARLLGRTCGLAPQVPITLKPIDIDGEVHPLNESEIDFCLDKGVLVTYKDYELDSFVIGQGINTLQNNEFLVNEDGTSFSIAVKRVTAQLNKEIVIGAKRKFFASENGPNRNTVTEADLKAWVEGFLLDKTASSNTDNLILRGGEAVVTTQQDNFFVSYNFVPNFEISKMVFTGVLLDK